MASTATRTGCPFFVLSEGGFDFLLLLTGIFVVGIFFLRCKWVDFIYRWCFGLIHLVVNF